MRVHPQLLAVAVSIALVAAWPLVDLRWQEHRAEESRQELLAQVEASDLAAVMTPVPAAALHEVPPRVTPAIASPVAVTAGGGEPFARITIPRFGEDWRWPLLEGTGEEVLALGPGHYTGTPMPGDLGNVGLAAHRAGHGDPFIDFDRLRPGDEIRIAQGDTTWTYAITSMPEIVPIEAVWVLDPLPGRAITLTTCWPKYGSSKRMYVRGELIGVER